MTFTDSDVAAVRHVVQRILVPCVFVVGLLGNSVSIYVLTRKRMRCTTNIYLTALAITDIIYLTMALLLSLKHYEYVQRHCKIYWQHYGTAVWLCDACAYISIYIAVCFTIERFIAIRYPLKRQTFCTESLAKKVIAAVSLFCLLSTISTAFEHQYRVQYKLIDAHGHACNVTSDKIQKSSESPSSSSALAGVLDINGSSFYGSGAGSDSHADESLVMERMNEIMENDIKRSTAAAAAATNIPSIENSEFLLDAVEYLANIPTAKSVGASSPATSSSVLPAGMQGMDSFGMNKNDSLTETVDYCQNLTFFQNSYSSLAQNELYMRIWGFVTLFVFVLLPLCVLATFNIFLIMLVRRSKNLRGEMTNASSMRRLKRKATISSVSQENRVTVTLIAVVLLFIVCQLPWAIYLIVSEHMFIDFNLQAIIGNVFNFLAAINAAANFFLYCVLSDKYRKMVRQLITGFRYRSQRNNQMNASLYVSASATTTIGSRRYRPTIIK